MRLVAWLWFLVFVQDKPAKLDSTKKSELKRLFGEYLTAPADSRKEILREVEAIEAQVEITKSDVESYLRHLIAEDRKGAKHEGPLDGRVKFNHPQWKGEYRIRAKAPPGARTALWISLHGGGQGVGDPDTSAPPLNDATGPAIHLYPKALDLVNGAWDRDLEEQYVIELVHAMKRSFAIDTNRIFLVGHSMGGAGTWAIGTVHADQFAGLASMAGCHYPEHNIANLKNTPIYFYHSLDDPKVPPKSDQRNNEILKELKAKYGAYDFFYKEYSNNGHGFPKEGLSPIYQWLAPKTRTPYPKMVVHAAWRPYKTLMGWLNVPAPSGRWGASPRHAARIENGNRIVILEGGDGCEIFIHEKMGINLAKPIVVVKGGVEVFNSPVRLSLAALLESFGQNRDPEHYYYAKVKLPGR